MKIFRPTVLLPLLCLAAFSPAKADSYTPAFKGLATLHTLSSKSKSYKAKAVYPTFRSRTPLARFVTQNVTHAQRRAYFEWLKSSKKTMKEYPGGMLPFEYDSYPVLKSFGPKHMISMRLIAYQYLGGAHGSTFVDNRNFALVAGKPKKLMLSDLFVPGTDYRKLVETKLFEKLKKDENAAWVQDKSVKFLTPAQFNNFLIEKDGVTWLFQEYEMGPFAAGQIETKLSVADLGPNFKKSLLP